MPKQIEFEGQTQEFPDDFTDEEISKALSGLNSSSQPENNSQKENPYGLLKNSRSGKDVFRDLAGGLAGTAQKGTSAVLEAGEYLTRKGAEKFGRDTGHPVKVPYWNAREFMGLEGNNQDDFQKDIQSKNPDAATGMVGGMIPSIMAGGASIPGQMISQGLYGASQASPDQQNAFGLLPNGRLGAAIKDAGGVLAGGKLLPLMAKGLHNVFSTVKSAFTPIKAREVANSIQSSHDKLEKSAQDIFENVGQNAKKRGVDIVPIKGNIIDEVTPHLADTREVKKFLEKARSGDYASLRKLQTDLFRNGTSAEKAGTLAEDLKAQKIFDLRDQINEAISKHLRKTGNEDLANNLDKARKMYRNLKQTYFNKKLPVAARDLVHPDTRKMPRNVMNTFSEESKPMNRLIKQNPFAEEQLQLHHAKKNAVKKLKYLIPAAGAIGTAGGVGYAGKKGYEYLTHE